MEAIAGEAMVSAVTVYNYYGSKLGLLLALVAEIDKHLMHRIDAYITDPPQELAEAVAGFARIVREHALSFLTKPVWQQALAASITMGDSEFGRAYAELNRELVERMAAMLRRVYLGADEAKPDVDALADCLFHLQNARFVQFVSVDGLSDRRIDEKVRADVAALLKFGAGPIATRSQEEQMDGQRERTVHDPRPARARGAALRRASDQDH